MGLTREELDVLDAPAAMGIRAALERAIEELVLEHAAVDLVREDALTDTGLPVRRRCRELHPACDIPVVAWGRKKRRPSLRMCFSVEVVGHPDLVR